MVKAFECLYPDCKSTEHRARGLCIRHYQALAQLVHRGQATWDDLERRGKIRPVGDRTAYQQIKQWALGNGKKAKGKR